MVNSLDWHPRSPRFDFSPIKHFEVRSTLSYINPACRSRAIHPTLVSLLFTVAVKIYDESLSDTSSLQLAGGYGDVIRRTVSTGATGSGPTYLGTSGGVPGDMSQASSTCNVTGEPPPMYNDDFHYKRKQQRMNSTNSS